MKKTKRKDFQPCPDKYEMQFPSGKFNWFMCIRQPDVEEYKQCKTCKCRYDLERVKADLEKRYLNCPNRSFNKLKEAVPICGRFLNEKECKYCDVDQEYRG